MAAGSSTTDLTMKLFVNTRTRRVLFAEASRDVVDFLHSLLESPDTAISLDDATWHGCIDNIVDTLAELDYLEDHPPSPAPPQKRPRRFFLCGSRRGGGCDGYVATKSGVRCPSCGGRLDAEAPPGAPGAGYSGDAAAAAPCMLMDDLSIGLASLRAVLPAALQEATVRLGRKEGLEILKASLHSSTVLTDVFLRGKTSVF